LALSVVTRTNSRMAFLAGPSFHDGSGAGLSFSFWLKDNTASDRAERTASTAGPREKRLHMATPPRQGALGFPRGVVWGPHTAKADVRHARVGGASVPGARAVAGAKGVIAQERPALLHAQRGVGITGVVTLLRPRRVDDHPLACPLAVQVDLV